LALKPLTYGELLAQLQALDLSPEAPVTLARFPHPLGIVQVGRMKTKVFTQDGYVDGPAECCLIDSDWRRSTSSCGTTGR
jgi:hypothetical protein